MTSDRDPGAIFDDLARRLETLQEKFGKDLDKAIALATAARTSTTGAGDTRADLCDQLDGLEDSVRGGDGRGGSQRRRDHPALPR